MAPLAFQHYLWNSLSHTYFQPIWIFHYFLNMSILFCFYAFARVISPSWLASMPIDILQNSTDPSKLISYTTSSMKIKKKIQLKVTTLFFYFL